MKTRVDEMIEAGDKILKDNNIFSDRSPPTPEQWTFINKAADQFYEAARADKTFHEYVSKPGEGEKGFAKLQDLYSKAKFRSPLLSPNLKHITKQMIECHINGYGTTVDQDVARDLRREFVRMSSSTPSTSGGSLSSGSLLSDKKGSEKKGIQEEKKDSPPPAPSKK